MNTGRTIPISAASSQPAILHTSVEQNPQVSHTSAGKKLFLLLQTHNNDQWAKTFMINILSRIYAQKHTHLTLHLLYWDPELKSDLELVPLLLIGWHFPLSSLARVVLLWLQTGKNWPWKWLKGMFLFSSRPLHLLGRPTWWDSRKSWRGRRLSWRGRSRRCRTGAELRTLAVSSCMRVRTSATKALFTLLIQVLSAFS